MIFSLPCLTALLAFSSSTWTASRTHAFVPTPTNARAFLHRKSPILDVASRQPTNTTNNETRMSTATTSTLQPSIMDQALNNFQIWAIQNPNHIASKVCLPPISLVEGVLANNPTYLDRKRLVFGNNFCCAGEVVLGDFNDVQTALTSPQARTYRLGSSVMRPSALVTNTGRKVFPLATSDAEITHPPNLVDGDLHKHMMELATKYVINKAALERQRDATAKRLLQELAQDYRDMDHSVDGAFFKAFDRGLQRFLIRYQHYVLLGLDPDDRPNMDMWAKLYYESQGAGYFLAVVAEVLQWINLGGAGKWPEMWQKTRQIYKSSPALASLASSSDLGYGMSLDDLVSMILPLIGIAAMPGPLSLAKVALGGAKLPSYKGRQTDTIDMAQHWDAIPDLNDRSALERHVYESGRLWMPVSATHRVATSDFAVTMTTPQPGNNGIQAAQTVTFPQGTIILVPMILSMLDEGFWGPTAYDYDASRKNLCPFSMLFNSVGDRSNGRMCPGKDLSMNLMVDMLQELGQVRRAF